MYVCVCVCVCVRVAVWPQYRVLGKHPLPSQPERLCLKERERERNLSVLHRDEEKINLIN